MFQTQFERPRVFEQSTRETSNVVVIRENDNLAMLQIALILNLTTIFNLQKLHPLNISARTEKNVVSACYFWL